MPFLRSRDCYSPPEDVYRVAKARGMDLVAITDHDPIDGCLELLDRHPDARDVIVGEEVSCRLPDGDIEVHLGVYGMTEALHRELQPLRRNVFEVAALPARARRVLRAQSPAAFLSRADAARRLPRGCSSEVPALEARNGTMLPAHNALVERIARRDCGDAGRRPRGWATIGGSDAHTLRRVGTTWTEAPARRPRRSWRACAPGVDARRRRARRRARRHRRHLRRDRPLHRQPCSASDRRITRRSRARLCLAFSAVSLPFQFIPALIALSTTRREARTVDARRSRSWRRCRQPTLARRRRRRRWRRDRRGRSSRCAHEPPAGRNHRHRARSPRSARRAKRAGAGCSRARAASARSRSSTSTGYRSRVAARSRLDAATTAGSRRSNGAAGRAAIGSAPSPPTRRSTMPGLLDVRRRPRARRRVPRRRHRRSAAQRGLLSRPGSQEGIERARPSDAWNHFSSTPVDIIAARLRPRRAARLHRRRLLVEHDRDRPGRRRDSRRARSMRRWPAAPTRWPG